MLVLFYLLYFVLLVPLERKRIIAIGSELSSIFAKKKWLHEQKVIDDCHPFLQK
ncbi:hypothetical protein NJD73_13975 [Bacillus altitudinis]|uniref:hypothetical protein n=1 Tax=Bacillus altitudinis TaxID=293387 RepID=UPI0029BBE8B4|nr:hypothetical protein [Bacillus altitudinis]MDX2365606.1 hypothetical protein [Bacillus altitudinis]